MCINRTSWLLAASSLFVSVLTPCRGTKSTHIHLAAEQGPFEFCNNSSFYTPLYVALQEGIPFETVHCPLSGKDHLPIFKQIFENASDPRDHVIVSFPYQAHMEDAVRYALSKGVAMIFVFVAPDVEALGFQPNATRVYKVTTDDFRGGWLVGERFCAVARGAERIAFLDGEPEGTHIVIQGFKQAIEDNCADQGHQILVYGRADWYFADYLDVAKRFFMGLFTAEPTVSAVIAVADNYIPPIVEVANQIRKSGTQGLLIGGYGNLPYIEEYLANRTIFATVDMVTKHPNDGIVFMISQMIKVLQISQHLVPANLPRHMKSSVRLVEPDPKEQMLRQILRTYDPMVKPLGNIVISTIMTNVTITSIDTDRGLVELVGFMEADWEDARLSWDPRAYTGNIELDAQRIWTPEIYVRNRYEFEELAKSLAIVTSTGAVHWSDFVKVTFFCDFKLHMFPFDKHGCALTWGSKHRAPEVTLQADFDMIIGRVPLSFSSAALSPLNEVQGHDSFVHFRFELTRDEFSFMMGKGMPVILLSIMSFWVFWLEDNFDVSMSLGITILLVTMTLRISIWMPAKNSWAEMFLMSNTFYQFVSIFLTLQAEVHDSVASCDVMYRTISLVGWCTRRCRRSSLRSKRPGKDPALPAAHKVGKFSSTVSASEQPQPDSECDRVPNERSIELLATCKSMEAQVPEVPITDQSEVPITDQSEDAVRRSLAHVHIRFGRWFIVPSYCALMIFMLVRRGELIEDWLRATAT